MELASVRRSEDQEQTSTTGGVVTSSRTSTSAEGSAYRTPITRDSTPINRTLWNTTDDASAASRWDSSLRSPPPSFGSSSSQFSSSVDSGYGGAAITPRDTQVVTAERKDCFGRRMYETDTEDDDSDGGIEFDMDMDPEFTYAPPSPAMVMDELASSSREARSPSVTGTLLGIPPLPPAITQDGRTASSMQADSPDGPHHYPPTEAPAYGQEETPEISTPDPEGEQVQIGNVDSEHSPASRSPSPSPPDFEEEEDEEEEDESQENDIPFGFGFIADTINVSGGFLGAPSTGQTNSFLENYPHLAAFPEIFMSSPTSFPDLLYHIYNQTTGPFGSVNGSGALPTAFIYEPEPSEDELEDAVATANDVVFDNDLVSQDMERYNSDFATFCGQLWHQQVAPMLHERYRNSANPPPRISREGMRIAEWSKTRPFEITWEDVEERGMDMQGIEWGKLELSKRHARRWRQSRYVNYRNIPEFTKEGLPPIKPNREFYRFVRHNALQCRLMHFQLRNILAIADRNNIFFSAADQVNSYHPVTQTRQDPFLDLSEDALTDFFPIRISTLGVCGGQNGVLMAGGFNGTFGLKYLNAEADAQSVTGMITDHENGITNHIHLKESRRSGKPQAIVCSNDNHIRIMDVACTKFTDHHPFDWAVNCSATSPDCRLRVVVGDSKDVLIVDADRGRTEFLLKGHQDFGFAAAWSDDGHTIATGNQDQTVRIYDARNLKSVLKVFPMKMAGCRTLRFSPIGNGGKRVLAMAEPADLVHFVDATTWRDAQTVTFWGEVGGVEFSPDGEMCYIANCDRYVGGITTLQRRCGVSWYEPDLKSRAQLEEIEETDIKRWKRRGGDLDGVFV
ncbi:hypothetical protein FN846DRAFT_968923 [Sphaerosporella brunnea]|uniref:Uncharacterized protein n=1 Tax=Sphaerosporella brunnea TaxID=1250544 RepID=A0A5J5EJK9_9PEZI|nr:hypothetical protein FN846DRAFT_968923 [Sphaerosporella brunnea]